VAPHIRAAQVRDDGRVQAARPNQSLPHDLGFCALTSLREKLVKIDARLTRHARRLILQMTQVAIPPDLFAQILTRISLLCPLPT